MQELNEILNKTEILLSVSKEHLKDKDENDFNYNLLLQPFGQNLPEGFEIGAFQSEEKTIPAFLPFNNTNGIAFSIGNAANLSFFNDLLERSTFQILAAIRYNGFKLTLIDGKNHGVNMSHLSQFDDTINDGKIYKEPTDILKVLNEVLHNRIKEYRIIIINNFPNGFTNESATALIKVLENSKQNKTRVLMTKEHEPSKTFADLDASISNKLEVISFDKNNFWYSKTLSTISNLKEFFTLNFGSSFADEDMQETVSVVNIMHEASVNPANESFEINDGIKIPIGTLNSKRFCFRLGHGASNYHAIIGGRSGKGKTVLLDNIISRATTIYSPDELRFILLDMKGIEFYEYKNLPHIQAFCSSTNFDSGMKIIEHLQQELKSRETSFKSVEASNIVDYKKKSGKIMPRLLVIIDEFQNLFTGNYKTDAVVEEVLIKQVLRIGRAYGIHLICCTQSLGDGVRTSFLNNIPLRIAFQMTQDQSRSFLSINNPFADSLKVGEAIYNEQDGLLSENKLIKIDHLQTDDIHNFIMEFVNNGKPYQTFDKLIVN